MENTASRDRSLWLTVFLIVLLFAGRQAATGDAAQSYDTANALIDRGSFKILPVSNYRFYSPAGGDYVYTRYGLSYIFSAVPSALAAKAVRLALPEGHCLEHLAKAVGPAAILAFFAVGFLALCRLFSDRRPWHLVLLIAALFTTPLWVSGRTLYSEGLQACLLVWGLYFFLRTGEPGAEGKRLAVWTGFAFGLLLNTKPAYLPLGLLAVFWWTDRALTPRERLRRTLGALLGFLPCFLAWVWFNDLRFGTWFSMLHSLGGDTGESFSTPFYAGLHGLLLSPGKSVFLYAPVLLACVAAWGPFLRQEPRRAWPVLTVILYFVFFYARFWSWHGDWAWGPRYLIPAIPLVLLPLARTPPASRAKKVFLFLAALGFLINLQGALLHYSGYVRYVHIVVRDHDYFTMPVDTVKEELVLAHFVPQFSPVVVHAWLLTRNLAGAGAASNAPWWRTSLKGFTGETTAALPPAGPLDLWFVPLGNSVLLAAACLLAALAALLFRTDLRRGTP